MEQTPTEPSTQPSNDQSPNLQPPIANSSNRSKASHYIKYSLIGLGLLLVVVGPFWLFKQSAKNPEGTIKPQVETVKVGNIGEYSIFNLIAKDRGYFEKNYLAAEVKEYPSGPPAMADLLAGKVDFAVAADFVGVNNLFTNKDLRILAQVSTQDNFSVMARKDKAINEPTDLKGKKVALTKKSAGEFFLDRFLAVNGLSFDDVDLVDLPPTEIVSQLSSGAIDAAIIFEPHVYNLQRDLGDKLVSWSAQSSHKARGILYTTNSVIEAKPRVIERYLQSLVDAETFLKQSEAEARGVLANAMKYDPAYVDHIWPKFDFRIALDQELLLTMEDQAAYIISNQTTEQMSIPNYLDYIYFPGLEKIKPEAVHIVH